MNLRFLPLALVTLPAIAGEALPSTKTPIIEPPAEISPWRVGVGVMWRNIGELSVNPNLQTGAFAGNFFTPNPAIGPADADADRTYDNGFVNQGAATPITGLTTFWGHQNDSQVSGSNINFLASGGLALSTPGITGEDESAEAAPYIEVSYLQPVKPNLLAGLTGNFSFVGLDRAAASQMSASEVLTTDSYALNGVIPPLAPYSGTFAGPGPLIGNQPTSRVFNLRPTGATSNYLFNSSTDLYSLAFGGEVQWQPANRCYLGFGAGAVVNYADWDAAWSAGLVNANSPTLASMGAANSGDDFLFGVYLKGSAGYHVTEQWSVEGFFRYDWNESLDGNVGPTGFEIDLTGWSAGFGVGFHF